MRYKKFILSLLVCLSGIFIGFTSSFAYNLWYRNGFRPVPTTIYLYDDANQSTHNSVSAACSAWNSAGRGTLITKASTNHTNRKFPYQNSRNEITYGERGLNSYAMRATKVQYSDIWAELNEVDIDINISQPFSNFGLPDAIDVQSCITHELGHLLGLDDVDDPNATMYFKIALGETKFRILSQDDKDAILYIY